MIAKFFIAFFFLVWAGTLSVKCQNDEKIQLTGTVVSVKLWSPFYGADRSKERYEVLLSLQFKNLTDHDVIIFKTSDFWGKSGLSFIDRPGAEEPAEAFPDGIEAERLRIQKQKYRFSGTVDLRAEYAWYLTLPEPKQQFFTLIPADGYYQCITSIVVDKGYKTEQRTGKSPDDKFTVIIPEFRTLKIKYTLSTRQWPGNADLRSARQKWKDVGELLLDSDGDYKIESASIPNILVP